MGTRGAERSLDGARGVSVTDGIVDDVVGTVIVSVVGEEFW